MAADSDNRRFHRSSIYFPNSMPHHRSQGNEFSVFTVEAFVLQELKLQEDI